MIIVGIVICVFAFIPTKLTTESGSGWRCDHDTQCVSPEVCKNNKCVKDETDKTASKHYWFVVIGLGIIALAIFFMWLSRWWRNKMKDDRGLQQVGGIMLEADILSNMFGRR